MIVFTNPGIIDLRMLSVFGLSVKETKTPIGQFGTGLKYAIAVILRNGGTIEMFAGQPHDIEKSDTKYTFGLAKDTVRGSEVEFVTMTEPNPNHGEDPVKTLPFTTQYGKNWEPWQAFRELYSNCIDEAGQVYWVGDGPEIGEWDGPPEDSTTFIWSGELAEKVWKERGTILLRARDPFPGEATEPMVSLEGIDIWGGASKHLYLKGIRVFTLPEHAGSFAFTYNLTGFWQLTEDRTLLYGGLFLGAAIGRAILKCEDPGIVAAILSTSHWEAEHIDWKELGAEGEPSEVFLHTSMKLHQSDKLTGKAKELFTRFRESYSRYGYQSPDIVSLSPAEHAILMQAIGLAKSKGVPLGDEFSFGAQKGMDEDALFEVNYWHHTIYLNGEIFAKGIEEVAVAITVAIASIATASKKDRDYDGIGRVNQLAHFVITGSFIGYPPPPAPAEEPEEPELAEVIEPPSGGHPV